MSTAVFSTEYILQTTLTHRTSDFSGDECSSLVKSYGFLTADVESLDVLETVPDPPASTDTEHIINNIRTL